ncbi:hypothetical protein GCM10017771_13790 [Streptomyces capitiformicae]|uniref:Uncharacterized protein n=1 Tax=Streptomyces capitiformicae TaxID=2014920 RepID=A0A919GHB7_9ACTN|nr:hypothetical protein GCM10017771_13790 [Streptomyces capitiformicae]
MAPKARSGESASAVGAARPVRARAPDTTAPMASFRMSPHIRGEPLGVALQNKGSLLGATLGDHVCGGSAGYP